ncbi:MAG: lysylphosphatidylglycerol synthase transmembrane domain-containing protein [Verrucomicrobiota bacterium]
MREKKIPWSTIIRLSITLLGVGYLAFFKEWDQIVGAVRGANAGWLVAALVAYGVTTLLGIIRWHILLKACHAGMEWNRTAQLTMIGLFANTFMPGAMGGDLFKAVLAAKEIPHIKTTVVMSIVMERALGFIAMFIVSTILILNRFDALTTEPATKYAVALYFVVFFLVLGLMILGTRRDIGKKIPYWDRLPFQEALKEAGESYHFFIRHVACFWGGLSLSIAAHFSLLLSCWFVACALGLNLQFWDLSAVLPLIALTMLVLPSIGGLGVRELAFQHFLTYAAINKETSIALSLIFFVVTLTWGGLGGIVYLQFRSRHPEKKV